jgi:transposase InsO family protein
MVENGLIFQLGRSGPPPRLYTREIVGWTVADNMREEMVREPLEKALLKKNAPKTMIIHSDIGGQYLSDNIKKVVKTFELNQSMSRVDDPYDNAIA